MAPRIRQAFEFLRDAADPASDTRTRLVNGSSAEVQALLKDSYGYVDPDVPEKEVRRVPSIPTCRAMLVDAHVHYSAYSPSAAAPTGLQALMRAEGHAMPLAVTGENEVAAAG